MEQNNWRIWPSASSICCVRKVRSITANISKFSDFCVKLYLGELYWFDNSPYTIKLYRVLALEFSLFITLLHFHGLSVDRIESRRSILVRRCKKFQSNEFMKT